MNHKMQITNFTKIIKKLLVFVTNFTTDLQVETLNYFVYEFYGSKTHFAEMRLYFKNLFHNSEKIIPPPKKSPFCCWGGGVNKFGL